MEDIRQTKEWKKYLEAKGWKVERVGKFQAFVVPLGFWPLSILKFQRMDGAIDFDQLKRVKRRNRSIFSIIEPQKEINIGNYYRDRFPYLPSKTVMIDLKEDERTLWGKLAENAKRLIKRNEKVSIEEVDPEEFYREWKQAAKIWILSRKEVEYMKAAFGDKMKLWISKIDGVPQSGLMLVTSKDTANYYNTWTNETGRKSGAHYKLVWEAILWAKRRGLSIFDFEGILDKRWPQKKWAGFSEFKKKFGGKEIEFPGCFSRWL